MLTSVPEAPLVLFKLAYLFSCELLEEESFRLDDRSRLEISFLLAFSDSIGGLPVSG
jgi:hypothetical protein